MWAVGNDWIGNRLTATFSPGYPATRQAAARVLAMVAYRQNGTSVSATPYDQAVAAGWMTAGTGPTGPITQLELDRGVVAALGLRGSVTQLNAIRAADGWHPFVPNGFGTEQMVKAIGARFNAPWPHDASETWPSTPLRRAALAVEAYQLGHLPTWWRSNVTSLLAARSALPAYSPLQKAVIAMAFRYANAPYVWGGTSPSPQSLFGYSVPGGFDCSGFVWWVLKLHTYAPAGQSPWSGSTVIAARTTYDMARALPLAKRVPRAQLRPGDVVFWSSAPNGVNTSYSTVYHAGIYLGNGWTINSHGDGDGVTLNSMASGWFHDAFAFGWHVLPAGR
jgi:cell wall-associated NlpC family hydrolase